MKITISKAEVIAVAGIDKSFKHAFGLASKILPDEFIWEKAKTNAMDVMNKMKGVDVSTTDDSIEFAVCEELMIDMIDIFGGVAIGIFGMIGQTTQAMKTLERRWAKPSTK